MTRLQKAQGTTSAFVDVFPIPVIATRAPTSADTRYPLGQRWIRTDTAQAWTLCQVSSGAATWAIASPGASDVDTVNSLSPVAGDILIDGGTNITDVNAGHTVTLNLDAAITLATSVTSPLFTSAAGMAITAAAANDITVKMGDAAGAKKVSFVDSAAAEQASLNSNGVFTANNLVGILGATGAAAVTGTTITANTTVISPIFTSTGAVDTNINAVAGQDIIMKMGDNAGVQKVLFHDSDDNPVASIDSNGGLTSTALTFTGLLTANASATLNTAGGVALNLGTNNDNSAVNIGTGTTVRTITIGREAATAHVVDIGGSAAGLISVDSATDVEIGALGSPLIGLGDVAPTVNRTITIGGGTVVTASVTDTVDIAPDGATTNADSIKTVNVNTGTVATGQLLTNIASGTVTSGTHTTSIASGNRAAGTMALNMMTGTGTMTANLGNADGLTTFNALGTINLNASQNNNVNICSGTSTGTVTIGNTLATQMDLNAVALNIGTGAIEQAIVIGNTTAATNLTLTAGATGDITVNGTFKEIDAEFLYSSGTDLVLTQSPILQSNLTTGAAPTGATGDVNLMYMQDGCLMEQFILGAGQTIIAPRMTSNGLNIALDLTDNEGAEYNFGARNNAKHAFTIGTSAAFSLEAEIYVADMSGCEPMFLGFRKVAANDADYTNYTDFYVIGLNNATSGTNVTLGSRLNSGGITLQDSTDAWGGDTTSQTIKILVSAAGVVTATIGGGAPSAPLAFTFDNGDVVMPFLHFLHDTTTPGEISLVSLKCGFQA